jgi:hypothetical protein
MNRPYLVTVRAALLPLCAPPWKKVRNRDAIATASRIARQSRIFLFAILARLLPFR